MKGSSSNLSLICRDENFHLAITQMLMKLIKTDHSNGLVERYKALEPTLKARYLEIYAEELAWIDHLFSQGSYIGMNAPILKDYLCYLTIRRMKAVGLHPTKEELHDKYVTTIPIPWVDKFIHFDKEEKLPQTEKIINYVSGAVTHDLDNGLPNSIKDLL